MSSLHGALLLATAAAAAAVVGTGAMIGGADAADYLAVSGGGGRAAIVGLAAIRELELRDAMIETKYTQGLSGGSWCVLINEAIGAEEALKRYSSWIAAGNVIGKHFSGLAPGYDAANVWKHVAEWEKYVDAVVRTPLSKPGSPFKYKQDGDARVLIGAGIQTPRGRSPTSLSPRGGGGRVVFPNCVVSMTGRAAAGSPSGDVSCVAQRKDLIMGLSATALDPATLAHSRALTFDRELQATTSSLAWLYLRMGLLPKSMRSGMPVHMRMVSEETRSPGSLDLAMYDLGIACNLPVQPTSLDKAGTTLVIDASADTKLGASLDQCLQWWPAAFSRKVVPSTREKIHWNGKVWDLSQLGPYREYVRAYDVLSMVGKPTGRTILVVLMGAYNLQTGKIMDDEERLKSLETMAGEFDKTAAIKDVATSGILVGGSKTLRRSINDGVFDPKLFGKESFDKMVRDVGTFYGHVFTAMLPKARDVVHGGPLGASMTKL